MKIQTESAIDHTPVDLPFNASALLTRKVIRHGLTFREYNCSALKCGYAQKVKNGTSRELELWYLSRQYHVRYIDWKRVGEDSDFYKADGFCRTRSFDTLKEARAYFNRLLRRELIVWYNIVGLQEFEVLDCCPSCFMAQKAIKGYREKQPLRHIQIETVKIIMANQN